MGPCILRLSISLGHLTRYRIREHSPKRRPVALVAHYTHGFKTTCQTALRAVVCGQESEVFPVRAGVPQGSILEPTLFVLYVNDCEDCLPGGSRLAVYADDTTLYKCLSSGDSIQNASSNLQQAVDAVAAWGSSWKIQFEPTKSQALTLSNHRPPIALPSIYFNNITVAEEDEIKFLGVTFDRQLSFRSHLRNVSSKANQRLHFFKKVAPLLNVPR